MFEGIGCNVMERPNIQIRKILRSPSVKRKNKTVPVSERVSNVEIVNSFFCVYDIFLVKQKVVV